MMDLTNSFETTGAVHGHHYYDKLLHLKGMLADVPVAPR
jgi:hypothetical protein